MHNNSLQLFKQYALPYFKPGMRVLEVGPEEHFQYLALLPGVDYSYCDISNTGTRPGMLRMLHDNRIDCPDASFDIVFSGQVLEHVRQPWLWLPELARISRQFVITISPISYPEHRAPYDCWRVYPDGIRSLFTHADLLPVVVEARSLDNVQTDLVSVGVKSSYAGGHPLWNKRDQLPDLLNAMGLYGHGVEVGTDLGYYAERLLNQWHGTTLTCVDPWCHMPDYHDITNRDDAGFEGVYKSVCAKFKPFGRKSVILRTTSLEAAGRFPDRYFDFVYLDANHSRQAVTEDLNLWYPKVKPGGILAGHDYVPDGVHNNSEFGVQSAVNEFQAEYNLGRCYLTDEFYSSWLFFVG